MSKYFFLILFLFILTFTGCHSVKEDSNKASSFISESDSIASTEIREIFYTMYLPDEMCRLFERVGANFYPDILNSADNFARYTAEDHISVVLGIYGVDMGYVQLYDQNLLTAKYLTTIQLLTKKINIPENNYKDLYENMNHYLSNKDSLSFLISELFNRTDDYLKKNEQDSKAALIVMGGWIEALYIAGNILENNSNNIEIMDRIAEQKYSLNSLISLLNNYNDNIYIAKNILMLKKLKRNFDSFDIYYEQKGFSLDTLEKSISSTAYQSGFTPEIAHEIHSIVGKIRNELIF